MKWSVYLTCVYYLKATCFGLQIDHRQVKIHSH